MDALMPDDVLDATSNIADTVMDEGLEQGKRVLQEAADAYEKGRLPPGSILPVFALGVVGGAVGSKVLKGWTGLLVGGGVAWWAYKSLSAPPIPGSQVIPADISSRSKRPA